MAQPNYDKNGNELWDAATIIPFVTMAFILICGIVGLVLAFRN